MTHAFDQNQRYLPLTIKSTDPGGTRSVIAAPADSFLAPPGDYMLFIVNTASVPSVAKWVRVGPFLYGTDSAPPDSSGDFEVDLVSSSTLGLIWSWTGDDGNTGTAMFSDLRMSTSPITTANFSSCQQLTPLPVPACAGYGQSFVVSGLSACTNYYFALRTADERGNLSALSRCSAQTACWGGGLQATRSGDREEGGSGSAQAPPTAKPSNAPSLAAVGATITDGLVATLEIVRDTLQWTLTRAGRDSLLVWGAEQVGTATVQQADVEGGWQPYARHDNAPLPIGLARRESEARIIVPGTTGTISLAAAPRGLRRVDARHSRLGVVDGDEAIIAAPEGSGLSSDTLRIRYVVDASANPDAASAVWVVGPAAMASGARGTAIAPVATAPLAFALHPNRPNPFAGITTIGFALPATADVNLELYDMQGRRVRVLARGRYPAGEHQLEWNGRDARGRAVSPGVYLYRLRAGSQRAERKLVVLP